MVDFNTVSNVGGANYTTTTSSTNKTSSPSGGTTIPDADEQVLQALLAELGLPDLPVSSSSLSLDTLLNAIGDDVRRQACRDGVASLELKADQQAEINEKELQEIADRLEEMKKKSEITEDDQKGMEKDLQKLVDDYIKKIDDITSAKEKELSEI